MNMNRLAACAALALILTLLCALALADISGIDVVRMLGVEGKPSVLLELRPKDNAGQGVRAGQQSFTFAAGPEKTELTAVSAGERNNGHIIVVDTSLYYYGSSSIRAENIRDIASAYLSRLSSDARVMFVLASDAKQPTCTAYMGLDQAKEFALGLSLGKDKSANLSTAVYQAFVYALSPEQGAPKFNSVMIIADPDLQSNKGDGHSLAECVRMREEAGQSFDVTVAVPYRDKFFKETSDERRSQLNDGIATLESFARQCGGALVRIPQTNQGVTADALHTELSRYLETTAGFEVDFSPLSGKIPTEPQLQQVTLTVTCDNVSRDIVCTVDTAILPPPDETPVPVLDEATPAPTPIVVLGQADTTAMQAVRALIDLGYLDKKSVERFDNDCYLAYLDFCDVNGLDNRDGIYEQTLALMISADALPKPMVTPEPTATPAPTPLVAIGQSNAAAVQAMNALRKLNYLKKDSTREFDGDCFSAYIEFCAANGIDPRDGIYEEGMDLLLGGSAIAAPEITPEPTPTPAPTPIVALGQADAAAIQAMNALRKMNYLTLESTRTFDSDCFSAYIEFCAANGIDPRDGIYEEGMDLLLSGSAVAAPEITPEPTATPEPTVPPEGYAINDQDTEGSGGFIARMQSILKTLNCYAEGSASDIGRLDQATVDAVNRYCEAYNWRNDNANGVSGAIVTEILTNGEKLTPIKAPEPTLQSRMRAFLMGALTVGGVAVPNWLLVVVGFVLILLIIVLLIFTGKGKQKPQRAPAVGTEPATRTATTVRESDQTVGPSMGAPASSMMADIPTEGAGKTRYLKLIITYAGQTRTMEGVALYEGKDLALGRKDASGRIPDPDILLDGSDKSISRGRHAVLRLCGGNVYLHDESTYHNTTMRGMTVYDRETQYGLLLSSGDEFVISAHTIRVVW